MNKLIRLSALTTVAFALTVGVAACGGSSNSSASKEAIKAAEERAHKADLETAARERQAAADKAALEAEIRRKVEKEGAARKAAEEDAKRKAEEQGHVYEKEFEKYCKEHGSSSTVHCPESGGKGKEEKSSSGGTSAN
jgi:ABC-type transporter MlaC component